MGSPNSTVELWTRRGIIREKFITQKSWRRYTPENALCFVGPQGEVKAGSRQKEREELGHMILLGPVGGVF